MKTTSVLVSIFLWTSILLSAQSSFKSHEVIIQFTPTSTQVEREDMINQLGILKQDVDADPNLLGETVLVEVKQFPVLVGGYFYQDEVDLASNMHGNHARLDGSGLNYIIRQREALFNTILGDFSDLPYYSPASPDCEDSYPGGPLVAGEFGNTVDEEIIVAILDSGLDPYYEDINQYLAGAVDVTSDDRDMLPIEKAQPYDFTRPVALDEQGHGTAVAGIIAGLSARADIPVGVLKIYPIKCFDQDGEGELFNLLQGLQEAKALNADIVNLSWSYVTRAEENVQILENYINELSNEENTLLIASAGNDGTDVSQIGNAPAIYAEAVNLITVGSINNGCVDNVAEFSNYGELVDLAAPGQGLIVPGLQGNWDTNAEGTSFSAPIVTAAAIQTWLCIANNSLGTAVDGNLPGTEHPVRISLMNTAVESNNVQSLGIDGLVNFEGSCTYSQNPKVPLRAERSAVPESRQVADLLDTQINPSIYPNPFGNELYILSADGEPIYDITLYSATGEQLLRLVHNSRSPMVLNELESYPPGVYIIAVQTQLGTTFHKVLKQ